MGKVRKAIISDLKELSELEKHIDINRLKIKINSDEIYVLIENKNIIGWLRFSLFWDEHPFMNMLYVLERYRNKGYGKELVYYWEKEMKKSGHNLVMTSTQSNEEAQHFYRKLNYKDSGGFTLPNEPLELILYKILLV